MPEEEGTEKEPQRKFREEMKKRDKGSRKDGEGVGGRGTRGGTGSAATALPTGGPPQG